MLTSDSILALLAIGTAAASNINIAVDGLSSQAGDIKNQIDGWSSGDGLQGALGIQENFPALQSSVDALLNAVKDASNSDIDTQSVQSMVASISSLLDSLTQRAGDFGDVGAQQIVANDISGLVTPAENIVNNIVNAVQEDCSKLSELNPALDQFSNGFASAEAAYGIQQGNFPSSFSCVGPSSSEQSQSMPSSSSVLIPATSDSSDASSYSVTTQGSNTISDHGISTLSGNLSLPVMATSTPIPQSVPLHGSLAPFRPTNQSNSTIPDIVDPSRQPPTIVPVNGGVTSGSSMRAASVVCFLGVIMALLI